jgi:hypothetical protein
VTGADASLRGGSVGKAWGFLRFRGLPTNQNKSKFPQVVNLSYVDASPNITAYKTASTSFPNTLFVSAAGNTNTNFWNGNQILLDREHQLFPASLGGKYPNFITVGAINEDGSPARFSYFGVNVVDLAAPGENISSSIRDEQTVGVPTKSAFMSGTSQAAPFVSFTAALLFKLDFDDVSVIRRRIIASTDFNPALKGLVWSSGSLNIGKALAVRNDIIQLKNIDKSNKPDLVQGLIIEPLNLSVSVPVSSGMPLTKLILPVEQIRKIIFNYDTDVDGTIWSALIVSPGKENLEDGPRSLTFIKCRIDDIDSIRFLRDTGMGYLEARVSKVGIEEVSEITLADPPQSFPRRSRVNRAWNALFKEVPKSSFAAAIAMTEITFGDIR